MIKIIKRLVFLRQEIRNLREKLEYYERELDGIASELVKHSEEAVLEPK